MQLVEVGPTGEIEFGAVAESDKGVFIRTFAGGFKITEDMEEFGESWVIDEIPDALARADVLLDNALHFAPILDSADAYNLGGNDDRRTYPAGVYPADRVVPFVAVDAAQGINNRRDRVVATLSNAVKKLPGQNLWILAGQASTFDLDAALSMNYPDSGQPHTIRRQLSPDRVIVYEGGDVEIGGRLRRYPGVPADTLYLIVPRMNFQSRVKHALRVSREVGDMSRLITGMVLGRKRLGILADITGRYGVIKVRLA